MLSRYGRAVVLRLDVDLGLPSILADEGQLQQVL
jgi:hypothetical protein